MKILIFKLGMLGDAIMATPFLRQLRRNYMDAQIDFLIGNDSSVALENNQNVNKIIKFDENIFLGKQIFKILTLIIEVRKNKYDKVFVLDKHWISNFIAYLFGIKDRIGFYRKGRKELFINKKVLFGPLRHEILYYLDLLKADSVKVDFKDIKTELFFSRNSNLKFFSSFIAVINSGGKNISDMSNSRMMPGKLFEKLILELAKKNKVMLLGSSDDRKYYKDFGFAEPNVMNSAGLSFEDSLYIMEKASCVVTTDCGAMHMAGAVNSNLICIFGPTSPKRKLPYGKNVKYIWLDEDIYDSNYEVLRKIPRKINFMKKIKKEDILKKIDEILE